jgi:acyl carrier protein
VTLKTPIFLDSLSTLSIIAFLDQNFSKKATANELREVSSINDILLLAGEENIR